MKNYLKVLGLGLLLTGASTSIQANDATNTKAQTETFNSLPPTPDYRAYNTLPPTPDYRAYNTLPPTPDYGAYNTLPPTPDYRAYNTLPPTPDYRAYNTLPPTPDYRAYNTLPPTPDYRAYNTLPPTPDHPVPSGTNESSKDETHDSSPSSPKQVVKTRLDFTAFMRANYQHTRC